MTKLESETEMSTNGSKPKPPRIRLAGFILQPQAFLDDGETLTPVDVQPIALPVDGLTTFDTTVLVADLQGQIDAQSTKW